MKVLVFSDLHIHDYQQHSVNHSRLYDCLSVIDIVFEEANKNSINHILFCGDLFDKAISVPTFVLNKTIDKFKEVFKKYSNIKFISISGNHDYCTKKLYNQEVYSSQYIFDIAFDNFILLDNVKSYNLNKDIVIYPLLFHEFDEDYYKTLNEIEVDNNKYNILMTHVTIQGCINNVGTIDSNNKGFDKFDCILAGDIHKKTMLSDKFLMCGNPIHRNLSDAGDEKGYFLVDLLKGRSPYFNFHCISDRFFRFVKEDKVDITMLDLSGNNIIKFPS